MIAAMAITFESSGARATSNLSHAPGFTDQVSTWSYSRRFGSYPHEREVTDLARDLGYLPRHQAEASCHGSEVWLPRCLLQSEY